MTTAVRVRAEVAARHRTMVVIGIGGCGRLRLAGGCHCQAEHLPASVPLPCSACDIGGDDVGRVPVQAAVGPVIAHRRSRVSV